jgi:L-asparaginase/Glu-tRNA(Gln) amidotransferase subunit D
VRNVVVVGRRGTISPRRDGLTGARVAAVGRGEPVAALPSRVCEISHDIRVEAEQFCTVGSSLFDLPLAFRIARRGDLADPKIPKKPDLAAVLAELGA